MGNIFVNIIVIKIFKSSGNVFDKFFWDVRNKGERSGDSLLVV